MSRTERYGRKDDTGLGRARAAIRGLLGCWRRVRDFWQRAARRLLGDHVLIKHLAREFNWEMELVRYQPAR